MTGSRTPLLSTNSRGLSFEERQAVRQGVVAGSDREFFNSKQSSARSAPDYLTPKCRDAMGEVFSLENGNPS
jgi:hypothetical protein